MMKKRVLLVVLLFISGCTAISLSQWDKDYGPSDPKKYDAAFDTQTHGPDFTTEVQPILNDRCIVCHACYDAPCQLKLSAYEGVTRGASKEYVYDSSRLLAAEPTRLFIDAQTNKAWRDQGFFPVLNERQHSPEANINGSVMAQMLLQKQLFPLPQQAILPSTFDFSLHRDQQCTTLENYASYRQNYPLWGMPYGLPKLSEAHHETLMEWLRQGAPNSQPQPLSTTMQNHVDRWERFLNQDSLKAQLMSRYLYEHLFLGHLYFEQSSQPQFFELVRSATPPAEPIDLISSRRPYDDPGVDRVYYRLRRLASTPVIKTHMPYLLDQHRMQDWQQWFLEPDYRVDELPGYALEDASNPFKTFAQLPSYARYRMMLDEAQYTIMGFIKGPVCRGNVALNVINDLFWVAFIHPKYQAAELNNEFLNKHVNQLKLPAGDSSTSGLLNWISYAAKEQNYIEAKSEYLNRHVENDIDITLNLLWDGDGDNENAALTIFRHFDSASVVKGFFGSKPQSAWIVSYPLLERIHYLLVAGYDVFGNVGHSLNSRIYMDFLRMEGEFNFLSFLPKDYRKTARDQWYRGSTNHVQEHIYQYTQNFTGESKVPFKSEDPLQELYNLMKDQLSPVLNQDHSLNQGEPTTDALNGLYELDSIKGSAVAQMPPMSILEVTREDGPSQYYSIISNDAFTNISHLFGEEDRRLPEEDSLSVSYGIIGAYPNVFFRVSDTEMPKFARMVAALQKPTDFTTLIDLYGVRRSSKEFWSFSDQLHHWLQQRAPITFGYLDYNRLYNK